MRPPILILESRPEVAQALEDVVVSARYQPLVRGVIGRLHDIHPAPAAIIVRICFEGAFEPTHAALERLGPVRPPVIALTRDEREAAEARRLGCDVVLTRDELPRLCSVLGALVPAGPFDL